MTRIALAPSKMVLLMSLVITGAHASPEQPLIKDTPFVSGQAYKKGFFWYDDPAKKSEEYLPVLPRRKPNTSIYAELLFGRYSSNQYGWKAIA